MKKTVSLLLALLLVLNLGLVTAFAGGGPTLAVDSLADAVAPGDTFSVDVKLSGNPGFASLSFSVTYDTASLELVGMTSGSVIAATVNPGTGKLSAASSVDVTAEGAVCTLEFKVLDIESSELGITLDGVKMRNSGGTSLDVEVVSGVVKVVKPHEHDWVAGETVAPTCTEKGYTEYECSICGEKKQDDFKDALGHKWEESSRTDATCTADGKVEYVCKNDPSHTKSEKIPALGHKWGEWEVVKEATESEEGLERRVCKNDPSHVEERAIPVVKPEPASSGINYVLHEPQMPEGNPLPAPGAPAPEAPAPEAPAPEAPAPEAPAPEAPPAPPAEEAPAPAAPAYAGFSDVDESLWYGTEQQGVIKAVVELGIMNGYPDGTFKPNDNIKLSEAITMAARVVDGYLGTNADFTAAEGELWYAPYVAYLESAGLLNAADYGDLEAYATRGQMAAIFGAAASALPAINDVSFDYIPDVDESTANAAVILALYKAGVLTGDAGSHAFRPDDNVTRAEAAAIIARVAVPEARQAF